MHVFIDDSGDGGFKVGHGSTSHLVMAACVFREPKQLEELKRITEACQAKHRFGREVKFNKTKDAFKNDYFEAIRTLQFVVRAISIDKSLVYSGHLRSSPAAFKSHAIRQLLTHTGGTIHRAKVVVDGQDTKAFGIPDRAYLLRMANKNNIETLREVEFADSRANVGLQLADMAAGAINAAKRTHRPSNDKYLRMLDDRFPYPEGSLWNFR